MNKNIGFELVDLERLKDWNNNNYKRLRYQTDTKYNKGFLPQQFESYRDFIDNKSQRNVFKVYQGKYNLLRSKIIKNFYKFGRYSTWFYMQTLKDCVGLQVLPNNLVLSDKSGSKSHRNGLCYALGKDDWVNKNLSSDCISFLEYEAKDLQLKLEKKYQVKIDLYQMETCLCSFKKIFRRSRGRYLGYYLDRQAEEIKQVEKDGWNGIDWSVFWDGRNETLEKKLSDSKNIRQNLYNTFLDSGGFDYKTI